MRVLIADDDPDFCAFVLQALEGSEFDAEDISTNPAAAFTANAIVLLDESACATRFAKPARSHQVVIASVADGDSDALQRLLLLGADDAFYKTLSPRSLLAHLTVARHRLASSAHRAHAPRSHLEEVLAKGSTGALVIRGTQLSAAIHVHDGGIGWVENAGRAVSLRLLLERTGIVLDAETARAVIAEARQTGEHFTQVLVGWALVDRDVARECLRSYLADELAVLLAASDVTVLFLPYDPRRASALRFEPTDLMPARVFESGLTLAPGRGIARPPPTVPEFAMTALRNAVVLPGCHSVVLMDRAGGRLTAVGSGIDNHFAWSVVHAMKTRQQMLTIEEESTAYVARALDEGRVLVAAFNLREVSLGLARTSLNACCVSAATSLLAVERSAS